MILTILGCGTSTGVPLPGCRCTVCKSPHPRNTRAKSAAALRTDSGAVILIDAGTDLRHQALRWNIDRVDAVLFTHAHADHILGIDDLRSFNFSQGTSIPCYATPETLGGIRKAFFYIFDQETRYEGGGTPQLELIPIDPEKRISLCGLEIQPFRLGHGRLEVLGYRIGDVAYATDCNRIPDESVDLLKGLRHLVLDGLRYEPHTTHFTIPQAIDAARRLGAEQTWLTHMTHAVDYEAVSATLPPGVALAYDGLELEVR